MNSLHLTYPEIARLEIDQRLRDAAEQRRRSHHHALVAHRRSHTRNRWSAWR